MTSVTGSRKGRTQKAAAGAAAGFGQYVLQILFQALLAPVVLRYAGQEALGVYSIIGQSLGYLYLVDLGLSSALWRELSQANGREDSGDRFRAVLAAARSFGFASNAVFAALCLGLGWALPRLVVASPGSIHQGRAGLVVLACWALVRTPLLVRACALGAVQELAKANMATLFGNVARLVCSLFLVWKGFGVTGLIVGQVLAEAITTGAQAWMFSRGHRQLIAWGRPDARVIKELLAFGWKALVFTLAGRMILQSDSIVVGSLFGAAAASVYYSTQTPAVMLWNLPLRLSDNAFPAIQELYGRGDQDALRRIYRIMVRYIILTITPVAAGIALFTGALVSHWVGSRQFGGTSMALALGAFALLNVAYAAHPFIMATGRIGAVSGLAFAEGVANVCLSIWLGRKLGLPGVMWASVLAKVPSTVYMLWSGSQIVGVSQFAHFRAAGPAFMAVLLAAILSRVVVPAPAAGHWADLVLALGVFGVTYVAAVWIMAATKEEQRTILATMRSMLGVNGSYGV